MAVAPHAKIALGDWGHAYLLEEEQTAGKSAEAPTYHAWMTAIDVWLDADHDGLPVGYADPGRLLGRARLDAAAAVVHTPAAGSAGAVSGSTAARRPRPRPSRRRRRTC